ncbi:MAG: DUF4331 family protein [Gemmatimonadaceae bacterium]
MTQSNSRFNRALLRRACGAVLLVVAVAACDDDDDDFTGPTGSNTTRRFTQIERLGNPLVSEVFFPKRDHGLHNTKGPEFDPFSMPAGGTDVPGHIKIFVASQGRPATIGNTLAAVLSPDMLMVFPNRAPGTGQLWLSWALSNGYGGRRLSDDVVDIGLSAVYGKAVDPTASENPGLISDFVPPSVRSFSTTFPYLENPRP